ncbi:hypothetical protein C8Q74DRAFT_1215003 [Fomes fomentarius]|nr:hypothetical protein C8Q74DRAFT_1215003 [Fomes fomentarius]
MPESPTMNRNDDQHLTVSAVVSSMAGDQSPLSSSSNEGFELPVNVTGSDGQLVLILSLAPASMCLGNMLRDGDEDEDWFVPRGGQDAGRATAPKPKSKDVQIKADKSKKKKDATKL